MAVSKCGLVGGKTFYVDGSASSDGDGSLEAPWTNIDEAIQNITTYQKNMSTYIYLNVKGTGNVPYPVTESISYLSDFTIRSYGDWDASPVVPEATRPRLIFTSEVSEHITHCDNFGTNSIEIISGSIGAIQPLEIRYSYIGMTDSDISANLKLVNTRLTSKTQFNPNINFTGTSSASTIELTKGSVLIVIDSWNINGLLPSATIEPVYYNGGVLIADRISNYATAKEPSVNEYAIGYYNPATINIKLPSPADRNKKNLWLNWDGDTSANSASFLPVTDCADIGCSASPTIEIHNGFKKEEHYFEFFYTLVSVRTPTSKRLFMIANNGIMERDLSIGYPDEIPLKFRPKNEYIAFKSFRGITPDNTAATDSYMMGYVYNDGNLHIDLRNPRGNVPMFVNSAGGDWLNDYKTQIAEYEPLNNL
jgi:hypothetical protein